MFFKEDAPRPACKRRHEIRWHKRYLIVDSENIPGPKNLWQLVRITRAIELSGSVFVEDRLALGRPVFGRLFSCAGSLYAWVVHYRRRIVLHRLIESYSCLCFVCEFMVRGYSRKRFFYSLFPGHSVPNISVRFSWPSLCTIIHFGIIWFKA